MKSQWKNVVVIAMLALSMGIAAPAWSGLEDPLLEDYSVHVIPFYRIDANWSSFLVIADTSEGDLDDKGSKISVQFFDAACNYRSDAKLELTKHDAQFFSLHDPADANGQFAGIPAEGVVLLDGHGKEFLTYILLVNPVENSLVRLDSIPCKGFGDTECDRASGGTGTWLRYDSVNTIAATFGDTNAFKTYLSFFSARGDLRFELLKYGRPHGNAAWDWATGISVHGFCDEIYLGSRRRDLRCTERVRLGVFNYTFLNNFGDAECAGKPGHIVTYASANGTDFEPFRAYSGFQETIATLGSGSASLIGTGYFHHSAGD